jgi:hypothetical protein
MLKVLLPTRKWETPRVWHGMVLSLSLALCSYPLSARAQGQPNSQKGSSDATKSQKSGTAAKGSQAAKPDAAKAAVAPEATKAAPAPDVVAPAAAAADPSKTKSIAPIEIFRDKRAEDWLDLSKLKPITALPVTNQEILDMKAQAGGANANIDQALIKRVVAAMAAKLTDRNNVQALVEPPAGMNMNAPAMRGVQEATTALLEPLFGAKSIKNQAFLTIYYRSLRDALTPLLKNHLIPRVQAMIILGECATPDFLPLYEAQIKDPKQTTWVKLWAIEGMVNLMEEGSRLSAQDEIVAAKTVSDYLDSEDSIPWPVQLRAMEALGAMRRGFEPNRPKKADMANAAMNLLADGSAKVEVRSEAARALGLMQIAAAVPKYNYRLVVHSAGQLAVELGNRIASGYAKNQDRSKYLTALLIGPVYQAFDGVPGARDSGLIHIASGDSTAYVQSIFDLVKPIAKAAIDLNAAGSRQARDRQKELVARVAVLKDFLEKNAPPDRHLVPDGTEYPIALLPEVELKAPAAQLRGQQAKNR